MDAAGANIFGQKPEKESEGQNPLKRQYDDIDIDTGGGDGDGDDDGDDDDEEDEEVEDHEKVYISPIEHVFEQLKTRVLASKLTGDSTLVEVFENILKSLKKENVTSSDADGFAEMVKQVLVNKFFVTELYQQCEDDEDWMLFSAIVNSSGIETTKRVKRTPQKAETTEERMALIRNDKYFDHASEGATAELVVSGVLSMLIGYCVSKEELWDMAELIGIETMDAAGANIFGQKPEKESEGQKQRIRIH